MARELYRAAAIVLAPTGVAPFFEIKCDATREVRINRIIVGGLTLEAAQVVNVAAVKNSAASTSGTPVAMTAVPLDSGSSTSTCTARVFTAAPTAGTEVGTLGVRRLYGSATGTAALMSDPATFDFGADGVRLRTSAQAVTLIFPTASVPATATTLSVEVHWTEESPRG